MPADPQQFVPSPRFQLLQGPAKTWLGKEQAAYEKILTVSPVFRFELESAQLVLGSALFDEAVCAVTGMVATYVPASRTVRFATTDPECPDNMKAVLHEAGQHEPLASLPEFTRGAVAGASEDDAWLLAAVAAQAMGAAGVHLVPVRSGTAFLALGPVRKLAGAAAGMDEAGAARVIVRLAWPVEHALSRAIARRAADADDDSAQSQADSLQQAVESAAVLAGELARCARQARFDAPGFERVFHDAAQVVEAPLAGIESAAAAGNMTAMTKAVAELELALSGLVATWRAKAQA